MHSWVVTGVLLMFAGTAHAQSYGPPTFAVGDTWKRSHGPTITVVKVEENAVQMAGPLLTCPTCIYHYDKNLTLLNVTEADGRPVDVTKHEFIPLGVDWKVLDFPLEVKKTWRFSPTGWFRGSPARYTVDVTVMAYEDVKTKAGTFKAYRINYEWTVHTQFGDFRWNNMWWFAPDVKSLVKFTTTSRAREAQDWELVSYTVK